MLEDRGHAVSARGPHPAPLCRILGAVGARKRGIEIDVTPTADGVLVLAAPELEPAYDCSSGGPIDGRSADSLTGCTAAVEGRHVCLVTLERALGEVEAYFDALPAGERGTVMIRLHEGQLSEVDLAAAVASILGDFSFTEQIYVASERASVLAMIRETLSAQQDDNVRTVLRVRDRAGALGPSIDEAFAGRFDVVLTPARRFDALVDQASRIALNDGGVAFGVYDAVMPSDFARLVRFEGVRIAVGPLAPALASAWELGAPAPVSCVDFLRDRGSLGTYLISNPPDPADPGASCAPIE